MWQVAYLEDRGLPFVSTIYRRWPHINRWFEALEMRETYMATKSDFYTHVKDIPPQ